MVVVSHPQSWESAMREEIRAMIRANLRLGGPPIRELAPQFNIIVARHVEEHMKNVIRHYGDQHSDLVEKIHLNLLKDTLKWLEENLHEVTREIRLELGMRVDPKGVRRQKERRW